MNFRRPIICLLFLCMLLIGGLVLTHVFRPSVNSRIGEQLISFAPETITEMSFDVKDEQGQWCTVHLKRQGTRWIFVSPYEGTLCDEDAIANILTACRQMHVASIVGRVQELNFTAQQYLTLKSVDKAIVCGFNLDAEMNLKHIAVAVDEEVVTVDATALAVLPKTLNALRTHALLPFTTPDYILELTWSEVGTPFTRAHRLPNGNWEVSQADVFVKRESSIVPLLEDFVKKDLIHAYVFPKNHTEANKIDHIPTEMLMKYGLDMENARLSLRVRGLEDPVVLSLGKPSTESPDDIYCLIHASQSIVLVPKTMREYFDEKGPLAIDYTNLAIVEQDETPPTMVEINLLTSGNHTTYVCTNGKWENKMVGLKVDETAISAFLKTLYDLRGDLLAIQQPEPTDSMFQIKLQNEAKATDVTLSFTRDESGDMLVYNRETKRLYTIKEDAFPECLLSSTLTYDFFEKTALCVNPQSIVKITVQRPGEEDLILARDEAVTCGWRTIQPKGAYVDVEVVDAWLKHLEKLPAHALIIHEGYENTLAPWGYRSNGTPSYQLRLILDFADASQGLRNILLFGETSMEENFIPMIIQGRTVEYFIDPEIVNAFKRSPFVYENR